MGASRTNPHRNTRKHIKIWRADANGQLGQPENEREREQLKIIGKQTKQQKQRQEMEKSLKNICRNQHMIPMNTWKRPPLTKHDKQRIAKKADTATILETIKQEQTTTWISPDGKHIDK